MGIDSLAIASMIAAALGVHMLLLTVNTVACRWALQSILLHGPGRACSTSQQHNSYFF